MKVKFECPKCSGTSLEEVMRNVTQSSTITDADVCGALDYDAVSSDGGEVDRYQCMTCGFVIGKVGVGRFDDSADLYAWLKDHNMLEVNADGE